VDSIPVIEALAERSKKDAQKPGKCLEQLLGTGLLAPAPDHAGLFLGAKT
jgi:hypothetical protein